MDAANEVTTKPPAEFQEFVKEPLIELDLTDSTELWLIQWPIGEDKGEFDTEDFNRQELSLNLHDGGTLGKFKGSSGTISYEVRCCDAQDPNATVFLSGVSEPKIVGKISRRVSLVHYLSPTEFEKQKIRKQEQKYQKSSQTSTTNSSHRFASGAQGSRQKTLKSAGTSSASMFTSRDNSSWSEPRVSSKPQKRKQTVEPTMSSKPGKRKKTGEPTMSIGPSTQDLVRNHSVVTSSGSLAHSNERKSSKNKHP